VKSVEQCPKAAKADSRGSSFNVRSSRWPRLALSADGSEKQVPPLIPAILDISHPLEETQTGRITLTVFRYDLSGSQEQKTHTQFCLSFVPSIFPTRLQALIHIIFTPASSDFAGASQHLLSINRSGVVPKYESAAFETTTR